MIPIELSRTDIYGNVFGPQEEEPDVVDGSMTVKSLEGQCGGGSRLADLGGRLAQHTMLGAATRSMLTAFDRRRRGDSPRETASSTATG